MRKTVIALYGGRMLIFCFWIMLIGLFLIIPAAIKNARQQRSLTIFTWPLVLDPIYLKNFERETGIKLYITYFENGPALLSKLVSTKGSGYDVIIPDDHSLELLIAQGLVKKIDKAKLDFWHTLSPELLGNYYDPNNEYAIPYYWGIYGIGYDIDIFRNNDLPASWSLLFDKKFSDQSRICMTDDPREAVMIAAQYLFGSIDVLKDPQARQLVKQLLIEQKKNVEVYTISRSDNLLQSKSCGIAAIMSPEVWRLRREHPNIAMLIPQEGSFIIMDAIAIPKATHKDAMIYQFINYIYRNEVIRHHVENFGYCSPLSSGRLADQEAFCPVEQFKKFDYFRNVISDDEVNSLWIEVLAA